MPHILERLWGESVLRADAAGMAHTLLANQRAQAVRNGFAVGNQEGPGPPLLAVEMQQLTQDDEYAEQDYSAQKAENQSEEAVHAAEDRKPDEVLQQRADSGTHQQHNQHNDGASGPWLDI